MAYLRDGHPYIWATWLAKVLAGDSSCEWAAWFKARYDSRSWQRVARSDFSAWAIAHTALLDRSRRQWNDRGLRTFVEDQNSFRLRGDAATLAGKPDLIAVNGTRAVISDAKTGQPRPSHQAQVMLYMYAVPRALPQHAGRVFEGAVVYQDHEVRIPAEAVDDDFIKTLAASIRRLSADKPSAKAPSSAECRFCNITEADCPERISEDVLEGVTSVF